MEARGFLISLVFAKAFHTSVGEDREKGKWVRALHPRPEGRGFPRSLVNRPAAAGNRALENRLFAANLDGLWEIHGCLHCPPRPVFV